MKSLLFLFAVLSFSQAFVVQRTPIAASTLLQMSDEPMQVQDVGETEQLLLARKEFKDKGLVQRLGKTVKKDGLDGVRAVVWKIFDVSNVVFPAMGVALSVGLFVNMMGYGYYFDTDSGLVVDTLSNIHQEQAFQAEAAKFAAAAADKITM